LYRKNWPFTALRQSETRDRDDQCRDHDNGEAWVPSSPKLSRKANTFADCTISEMSKPQPNINPQIKAAMITMT
jgi:hypothetical protein